MEIQNIDLVYNSNGIRVYPESTHPVMINQYATNYKLRVGFYEDLDNIASVKVIVTNGKANPARVLYATESGEYDGKNIIYYTYQLTQYDTYLYTDEIELSINTKLDDEKTEFTDTVNIPMTKQYYGKLTPQPLEDDGTLNSVIVGTNKLAARINDLVDNQITKRLTVEADPDTLMLRDESGRAKISAPVQELDIVNKKYVDDIMNNKLDKTSDKSVLYGTSSDGSQRTWKISLSPSTGEFTIAERSNQGNLYTTKPVSPTHCANKEYVDTEIVKNAEESLNNAKKYTDAKISETIKASPEVIAILEELADAIKENPDIIDDIAKIADVQLELDNKVTKLKPTGEYPIVYAATKAGETTYEMDDIANNNPGGTGAIVRRDVYGGVYVPLNTNNENGAVNLGQLNSLYEGIYNTDLPTKLDKPTDYSSNRRAVIIEPNSTDGTTEIISNTSENVAAGRLVAYGDGSSGDIEPSGYLIAKTPSKDYQVANKNYVDGRLNEKQDLIVVSSRTPEIPMFLADEGPVSTVIVDSYHEGYQFDYDKKDIVASYKHTVEEVSTDTEDKYEYMTLYADVPTQKLHVANKRYVDASVEAEFKVMTMSGDDSSKYYYLDPGYIYEVFGIGPEKFKVSTTTSSYECSTAILMNDVSYIKIDGNPIGQRATAIMNTGGGYLLIKRYKRYKAFPTT